MDEMSEWVIAWIAFSAEARQRLVAIHGREIQSGEFRQAVRELWGAENDLMMLYTPIPTVDEIVEQLKDYPFESPLGEPLQTITLTDSILPEDWPKLLLEQVIKQNGEQWEIHKYDADPFPSNPHAHNHEARVKLHLGTGELFKKRDRVGKIRCKELQSLRAKVSDSITLPPFKCD
jgi:hypothetical protein